MANATTLTPSSSSAVTASSRARTRLTGLTAANFTSLLLARRNEPFVGEREELVRVDLHAPQLPVVRAVVGERPKEGVGLLLGEDRVKLAVDRPALLVVERELALDDQPVHFGVGIAAEVVLPVADFGRMEQRRDVRRVVEHPGREHDVEVVLEEDVLLPRLPLLELDGDRDPGALEIILEREHDALDRFALLLDRDLERERELLAVLLDRKSTRLNSSHLVISYAVFCLKKKKKQYTNTKSYRCRTGHLKLAVKYSLTRLGCIESHWRRTIRQSYSALHDLPPRREIRWTV